MVVESRTAQRRRFRDIRFTHRMLAGIHRLVQQASLLFRHRYGANQMSRLILLLALLATPALAAGYEQQSDAIKVCQQADPDDHPSVFYTCMKNAGWEFCGKCQQFGITMGGECASSADAMDRPACWYRNGEKPQNTSAALIARWRDWIKNRGWEKQQKAPFYPFDEAIEKPAVSCQPNQPCYESMGKSETSNTP